MENVNQTPEQPAQPSAEAPVQQENESAAAAVAHTIENSLNVGVSGTVQAISSGHPEVDENKGLTKVKVKYPKDFKGQKFFADGDEKFVSKECADQFVEAGIAKII
jgi:hypothetical protein